MLFVPDPVDIFHQAARNCSTRSRTLSTCTGNSS
jgi:hypothetical protein